MYTVAVYVIAIALLPVAAGVALWALLKVLDGVCLLLGRH